MMPMIASQVLPRRRFLDLFKYLLKPRDVFFGLGLVLLERSFELFRLRGLCHLGQGAQDFLFRKIDVLEGLVKQFLQVLVASHAVAPWVRGYLATGRQNFSSAADPGPAANNKRICNSRRNIACGLTLHG